MYSEIVSRETFLDLVLLLKQQQGIAVDTETTGLYPYKGDSLFSIIFGWEGGQAYLNFNPRPEIPEKYCLDYTHIELLKEVLGDRKKKFFFHNAKFDLAFLRKFGLECLGRVHDTRGVHRIIDNEAFLKFSLANCASAAGFTKSDAVEEFIAEYDMWEWEQIPGKNRREKKKFYNAVPFDIITNYGLTDGKITFGLAKWQLQKLEELEGQSKAEHVIGYGMLYCNELALTKTVFEMESRGVLLDVDYCKQSIEKEDAKVAKLLEEFKTLTGEEFEVSPKLFAKIFKDEKMVYGEVTPTGKQNPKFDSAALATFAHPAAKMVLEYRDLKSNLDFLQGFLFHADAENTIHTNFNQDGTVTGRFSSSNPNLQNIKKDSEQSLKEDIVIRRAIIPRPGYLFAMLDYSQMEYRLMLDYAGSRTLIDKVLGGLDVHQATAELAGITRKQAKTTNFAVLYGSGLTMLSSMLGVTMEEAQRIREAIFNSAPEVKELIDSQNYVAATRGYVVNWLGRRCRFHDSKFSYKAVNSLIQGGCADVVKVAMNNIHKFLQDKKSKMVLTVHDEIVLEVHASEKDIIPAVKMFMETAYTPKFLPLTVDVEHSYVSLADKVAGFPD